MKNKLAFASFVILASQAAAFAGELEAPVAAGPRWYQNGSFYTSLSGGAAIFSDGTVDVVNNPSGKADFEFDTGSSFALRVGHDFGALRVEGEFSYTQAEISALETSTGSVSVGSDLAAYGFMANALWDIDFKPFTFSAGFGVGATKVKVDAMENSGFIAVAESGDTVFSAQLILGLSYQLNERTSVGLNYRYLMISDFDDNGYVDTGGAGPSDISFDNMNASIVELFVSWRF
jgi:opacity protein-like surface antigen